MTAKTNVILWCDHPDCDATFTRGLPRVTGTRVLAKRFNWTHVTQSIKYPGPQSLDYCSEHKP